METAENIYLSDNTRLQGGRFKIVRFIGSGGFGCTYEGEHTMLQRRVAIKEFFVKDFCDREGSTSKVTVSTSGKKELVEKLKRKFVEEARATSKMEHPNIVKVYDVFEENGAAYYVMDYIDGKSLEKVVKERGPLPEQTALKYIRQVADALGYVHSLNRLHLDLKPGNIMTDGKGNAVLVDFGASKQYDEVGGENTSTLIGKTPGYAPIEQMGNSVTTFSPATDIYALGATLYKLLTGVTPPGSNLLALLEKTQPNHDEGETIIDSEPKKPEPTYPPQSKSMGESKSEPTSQKPKSNKGIAGIVLWAAAVIAGIVLLIVLFGHNHPTTSLATSTKGKINGHDYVDLGLSVKWVTCNVGASSPSDYGNYYAWGETKTKSEYTSDNSVTYGKTMGSIAGNPQYDAATANWGGTWRMPTIEEIDELVNKCTWKRVEMDGHEGYKVTGPNGNSIFLPAAGWRYGSSLFNVGEYGRYWGATPYEDNAYFAYGLRFGKGDFGRGWDDRSNGRSVRPVSK